MNRLSRALVLAAALLVALGAFGFAAELVRSHFVQSDVGANYVTLVLASLLGALVVGTWLILIRPDAAVGWLLAAGAAGAVAGVWRFSTHPWLAVVGLVAFYATILLPFHAALLQGIGIGRGARRWMIAAEIAVAVLAVTIAVTAPAGALDRWFVAADARRHVTNHLLVYSSRTGALVAQGAWWGVVLIAALIGTTDRVGRWRRVSRRVRRLDSPVIVGVVGWTLLMAVGGLATFVHRVPVAPAAVADYGAVILPTLTLALLAGVIAWVEVVVPRISRRGESVEIHDVDRAGLRTLLADLLASSHVDVAYKSVDGWVDVNGAPIDVAADRRHHTTIDIRGEEVAVVLHERDVPADAVQLAAQMTAAQLQAERATAVARARTEAVRAATSELVRAGDKAATSVTSDLLAGPIPALVELARHVRTGETTPADAAEALREVTAQVRKLSHGLVPRELASGGLGAILGARAGVDRRLPQAVEVTIYMLAHDDPRATVRDDDATIVITRTRAPGAEGAARAAALGGTIDGTVITVPAC